MDSKESFKFPMFQISSHRPQENPFHFLLEGCNQISAGAHRFSQNFGRRPVDTKEDGFKMPSSRKPSTNATLPYCSLSAVLDGTRKDLARLMASAAKQLHGEEPHYPTKDRLTAVENFFKYTEEEGRRLFKEMDRDGDGRVKLEDVRAVMRARRLPPSYASAFLSRVRRHWLASSFGWDEFHELMASAEKPTLKAFTALGPSHEGNLGRDQLKQVLTSLELPATDENVGAMMRVLDVNCERDGRVSYGEFRNFVLLIPKERMANENPSVVWFEAATMVPVAPPALASKQVLVSAIVGGMASCCSTAGMHPLDTLKTRLQSSVEKVAFKELFAQIPRLGGPLALYKGIIPALVGSFGSNGIRTGVYEAVMLALKAFPIVGDLQAQSVASFVGTLMGTSFRIPNEVMKQRLQAQMYPNVVAAFQGILKAEGVGGFFNGTSAMLAREIPLFVVGMVAYEQLKNLIRGGKEGVGRELAPWEKLGIGAMAGALAAMVTTPADVLKTRMMLNGITANVALTSLLQREGPTALFKGALARAVWIAPLGALNFAGYELAKRALAAREQEAKQLVAATKAE
eukprot:jgi/Mesvir1/12365/Mv00548-RA.1